MLWLGQATTRITTPGGKVIVIDPLTKLDHAPMWNAGGLGNTIVTLGLVPPELAQRFGKSGTVRPFGPNGIKITAVHAEHSRVIPLQPGENAEF